jgi:hypothetical protein
VTEVTISLSRDGRSIEVLRRRLMDKNAESCSREGRNEGSIRQSKIGGEECIREGILAVAILTRNALWKDVRTKTGQMDIAVVSLRLLLRGMRPGFLVINTVGDARRMRDGVVGRVLWLFVSVTRYMSLATYEAAHSTYDRFKHQKNDHHG